MKVIFYAKLGEGPTQVVGEYVFSQEEWEEEMEDFDGSQQNWLQNRGVDWAHEAVHSDCLNYWADLEDED